MMEREQAIKYHKREGTGSDTRKAGTKPAVESGLKWGWSKRQPRQRSRNQALQNMRLAYIWRHTKQEKASSTTISCTLYLQEPMG